MSKAKAKTLKPSKEAEVPQEEHLCDLKPPHKDGKKSAARGNDKENQKKTIRLLDLTKSGESGPFLGSVLLGDKGRDEQEEQALASWKGVDNADAVEHILASAVEQIDKAKLESLGEGARLTVAFHNKRTKFALHVPALEGVEVVALDKPKKLVLLEPQHFQRLFEYLAASQYFTFAGSEKQKPEGIDIEWPSLKEGEDWHWDCPPHPRILELKYLAVCAQYFALKQPNHTLFYKWITPTQQNQAQARGHEVESAKAGGLKKERKGEGGTEILLEMVEGEYSSQQRIICSAEKGMASLTEALAKREPRKPEIKEETVRELGQQLDGFLERMLKISAIDEGARNFMKTVITPTPKEGEGPEIRRQGRLRTEQLAPLNFYSVKFLCSDTQIVRRRDVKKSQFEVTDMGP